jgi:hypothetical protein
MMRARDVILTVVCAIGGWFGGWGLSATLRNEMTFGDKVVSSDPLERANTSRTSAAEATAGSFIEGHRDRVVTETPRSRELSLAPEVFGISLEALAAKAYWNPNGKTLDDRTVSELTAWLAERKREWESCKYRWTGESYRACEEAFADGRILRVCVLPGNGRFAFPPIPKLHPSQAEQNKVVLTAVVQTVVTPDDAPGLTGLKEAADAILLEAHDRVRAAFGAQQERR